MSTRLNPITSILSNGSFNCISAYFLGAILAGDESYRLYSSHKRIWLAVVKHNIGYCTAEQLDAHKNALVELAATTSGRLYNKSDLTSRNWFTPNKQGFAIGFESDDTITSDDICDYAENLLLSLSHDEKLCIIRGAFDGRSSIDVNRATNDLRYVVLDCGNNRAMDILAKLLSNAGIRYNCNYARERLEGGEPRKPQLRVTAASGALFAQKIGYISPARMAILQSVFGDSYAQQDATEILTGLKLLVRSSSTISKHAQQIEPRQQTPLQVSTVASNHPVAVSAPTPRLTVIPVNTPVIVPGDKVIHKAFGSGTVIRIEDNSYLEIDFSGTIRKFQHPQAFTSGFLKIEE